MTKGGAGLPPGVNRYMRTIEYFASRQFGLITTAQLMRCGLDKKAIRRRLDAGWLVRVHRGVYSLGGPPRDRQSWFAAAILACGSGSGLSHRAAAEHLRMLPETTGPIDVVAPGRSCRSRPGITVHRTRLIFRGDIRKVRSLPATIPASTLLDLAATQSTRVLADALNSARRERIITAAAIEAALVARPTHPGSPGLRRLLERETDGGFDRSEAERRLRKLIRLAGFPAPRRNVRIHGHELDFWWPDLWLNLEMDGYLWHSTRDRFDSDRRRDTELAAKGIQVVRVSFEQLDQPERLIAQLASAIAIASQRAAVST